MKKKTETVMPRNITAFPPFTLATAAFSEDRKYRFLLVRVWDMSKPMCAWIGLNPSVADELKNDPTITRECRFSHQWGYGGILKFNLLNYITPYPEQMMNVEDLFGRKDSIKYMVQVLHNPPFPVKRVMAAWGTASALDRATRSLVMQRATQVRHALLKEKFVVSCLGFNDDGSPKHPLYLPSYTTPVVYHNPN